MFVRRVLEFSFFCFYWICIGLIALKFVYRKWLEQQLKVQQIIGGWPLLALFVFILFIIYMILRYCMLLIYAKCKLSEKRMMANLKKECRSLESGINKDAQISTESLLSEPTFDNRTKSKENVLSNVNGEKIYENSVQSLSKSKANSLKNILISTSDVNEMTHVPTGNINYGSSVEILAGNSKFPNEMYTDLTESLKHAISKRSKSLENIAETGGDAVDASVEDLLEIYQNFYEIQNSLQRTKSPIRKAPPVPTHIKCNLRKEVLASNTRNLSEANSKLKTVNEKCQAKKLW